VNTTRLSCAARPIARLKPGTSCRHHRPRTLLKQQGRARRERQEGSPLLGPGRPFVAQCSARGLNSQYSMQSSHVLRPAPSLYCLIMQGCIFFTGKSCTFVRVLQITPPPSPDFFFCFTFVFDRVTVSPIWQLLFCFLFLRHPRPDC
jgi:hypothetical protein